MCSFHFFFKKFLIFYAKKCICACLRVKFKKTQKSKKSKKCKKTCFFEKNEHLWKIQVFLKLKNTTFFASLCGVLCVIFCIKKYSQKNVKIAKIKKNIKKHKNRKNTQK